MTAVRAGRRCFQRCPCASDIASASASATASKDGHRGQQGSDGGCHCGALGLSLAERGASAHIVRAGCGSDCRCGSLCSHSLCVRFSLSARPMLANSMPRSVSVPLLVRRFILVLTTVTVLCFRWGSRATRSSGIHRVTIVLPMPPVAVALLGLTFVFFGVLFSDLRRFDVLVTWGLIR